MSISNKTDLLIKHGFEKYKAVIWRNKRTKELFVDIGEAYNSLLNDLGVKEEGDFYSVQSTKQKYQKRKKVSQVEWED